jgi:regulator of sigma E protease
MSYFLAFLGFALLILLHEAGHFLAAKAVGMRVERFSLFFGPMVVKRQRGETEYGIGVIPLGGYVKITGMSPKEVFESSEIEARAYINQPPWKRIVVIAAGPAVNLILAFLLAWAFFLGTKTHDVTTPQGSTIATTTVGAITKGSPAQGVLRLGDTIVSVDGVKGGPEQIHDQIVRHTCAGGAKVENCPGVTPVTMVVRRHGALKTLQLRPRWNAADKAMVVGILFFNKTAPNGVLYSAGQSAAGLWRVTKATASVLAQIFKPKERHQLHSIVGGLIITSQAISAGWTTGVERLALISLALGLINLLPLLPFDGGHIFWAIAEKLRGHRIPYKVMERATIVGVAVIALLMVIGVSNDISSIAGSGFGSQ